MRYLHTMVRVKDLGESLKFYVDLLGMTEIRRIENEKGKFTLVFLAARDDIAAAKENKAPCLELTYNWDTEDYTGGRNFGHLAYEVDNIYDFCAHLQENGVVINRPRGTATWPSCAHRTAFHSKFCRKAKASHQPSRGYLCRTPVPGRDYPVR
ncbi:lactoylglutathione lyase [Agrobacterium tumefaciens]|nr:lactoylglutathione lyase [Agrobacterium tumefaciens]